MNKNEALWVVIRASGLVFLVLALISFVKLVSMFSYYIYVSDVFMSLSMSSPCVAKEIAMDTAKAMTTHHISNFILYGLAGYYFMRKGKFVHNVISK